MRALAPSDRPREKLVQPGVRELLVISQDTSAYGVDLKQIGRKCYVIEVNDNPTIESGVEDRILKDALYDTIMAEFVRRIQQLREGRNNA